MKRGEIWTVAAGGGYAGKPRPAVIVQDDAFAETASVTVCVFTSNPVEAPLYRVEIAPSETNGLKGVSRLMADKLVTVPRAKLGNRIGALSGEDIVRLNRAMLVFLGIASSGKVRAP